MEEGQCTVSKTHKIIKYKIQNIKINKKVHDMTLKKN